MKLQSLPSTKLKFIEPMYARLVNELPEGKDWPYEVKLDGYRCLAGRNSTGVTLWSRRGNLFTNQIPQIARVCEQFPLEPSEMRDYQPIAIKFDPATAVDLSLMLSRRGS